MMMRPRRLALIAACFLGGCFSVEQPYPEKTYYVLEAQRPTTDPPAQDGSVLMVTPVRVAPQGEGRELVYRQSPQEWESDFYHEFFFPVQAMITDATREWMQASGALQVVATETGLVAPTLYLESSLTALHGDYADIDHPRAVMEMQFFLTEPKGSEMHLLLSREYHEEVPLEALTPEALVAGLDKALADILQEVESAVAEARAPKGPR